MTDSPGRDRDGLTRRGHLEALPDPPDPEPVVHPRALVAPGARIGRRVRIDAGATIGPEVELEADVWVGAGAVVTGRTVVGAGTRIYPRAIVGSEGGRLIIGERNLIREYAYISGGTGRDGRDSVLGHSNLVQSYASVGPDCRIGSRVVIGHGVTLDGQNVIEDDVIIGGLSVVLEGVRLGRLVMVGAHTLVDGDVPPYLLVDGHPARLYGPNTVGLKRHGFPPELRLEIKRAYRLLCRSGLSPAQAAEQMEKTLSAWPELTHFIGFVRGCSRGIVPGAESEEGRLLRRRFEVEEDPSGGEPDPGSLSDARG